MLNLKKKKKKRPTYLPKLKLKGRSTANKYIFLGWPCGCSKEHPIHMSQQMGKKIRCYPQTFCSLCPMHCILFLDNHIVDFGVTIFTLVTHFVYIYMLLYLLLIFISYGVFLFV